MKRKIIYISTILIAIIFTPYVYAANPYCGSLKSTFMFIGEIVKIARILVPLIIILFGMKDLFSAVTSSKDGAIAKSLKSLVMRLIAGVAIFLLPVIVEFAFSLIDDWTANYEDSYLECAKCILNVDSCK